MKTTRRLLIFCALTVPFFLSGTIHSAENAAAQSYFVYVGNYTAKTESKGIYLFEFSPDTGQLTAAGLAAETADPSWVTVDPNGKYLYAANESGKGSTVSAFSIDPRTGKLTLLNKLPALGEDPCYLSFDQTGKYLFVANYTSGNVVVFPIEADGRLGQHTALETDPGAPGPDTKRQDGPHAHWVEPSADNHFVYVSDLGLDRVLVYSFDQSNGTLHAGTPQDQYSARVSPGAGPRHVVFGPDEKYMYVLAELTSTVTVFAKEGHETFQSVQQVRALPKEFTGRNDAAEIAILPNGKFLYTSNRGHDSIVVFSIDPVQGTLSEVEDVGTGGKEPRNFAIDPSGHYLLAENQNSNTIVEFKIDQATGKLTRTGRVTKTPSPICIAFLRRK